MARRRSRIVAQPRGGATLEVGESGPRPRRRTGISDAHLLLFAVGTGSWCSGLTCQPVTLETAGSNPVEPAIMLLPAPSPPGRGSLFPAVQIGAATLR